MFKNLKTHNFNSKLLLFGEYTVLTGSSSLAIPFPGFSASFDNNDKNNFSGVYRELYEYLLQIDFRPYGIEFMGEFFRDAIRGGLYFNSDIPTGYGLGSSGAFTSALYYSFFKKSKNNTLLNLKNIFSLIEAYFHGQSSGIDPLIIYLNKVVYTGVDFTISTIDFDGTFFKPCQLGIIDSGIARRTSEFVAIFKEKIKNNSFYKDYITSLSKENNIVTKAILSKQKNIDLFQHYDRISNIQFHAFPEMITSNIYPIWKEVLSNDRDRIKLCGAGGGGYYFILSKDISSFIQRYPELNIIPVFNW